MRIFNRTLALLSLVALSSVVAACGQDISSKVSCSTNAECLLLATSGGLIDTDAGDPAFFPECCSGTCVLPAGGCDTGYRYLTSEPAYGGCISADPMCPVPPDMAMPVVQDLSTSTRD
jgi:hypothetical protein